MRIEKIILLTGAASAALFAAPALAQDGGESAPPAAESRTPQAEAGPLPENVIIITARRRAEAAQDVPLAISTLDARTINDTGNFSVQKLQQLAPTLQVYSSNPRNTAVNIRGIGVPFGLTNDGFEQGVGIYIDDVYNARVASAVFDFLDVQQVEVLRGPQGTLYGKNTTAGAVNIRTNQPTFHFEGSAELTLGNYNFKQAKAAVSGPLSDTVAARLAISSTHRQGTVFNVATNNWINEQDNLGLRGQVLFRPADSLDITLAGDFSSQNPECCGGVYVGYGPTQRAEGRQYPALTALFPGYEVPSTDPFDRLANLDSSLNAGNKIGGVSLRGEWDIGGGSSLTSITAWRFWDWKPENDRDYTGLNIVSKNNNPSQHEQYSQEIRYNYTGDRLNLVLGAFAFKQRVDTQGISQTGSDASLWNFTGGQYDELADNPEVLDGLTAINTQFVKATSLALFGQVDFKVTDRLTIQPGVRLNYDKKNGHYRREVFDADGNAIPATGGTLLQRAQRSIYTPLFYEPEFKDWNFSYDLTLSYELADDVLAYATYAKSFKTGGINQNGVPTDANAQPIEAAYTIRPESVQHWEAGLKTQFWDRRATLNLAAFRTSIKDFQANVSNGQLGVVRGYLANAEKVRSQGVEVDFSVRPSERFTAYVNGAYTDATYVRFIDAPCPPELAGGSDSPANCDISGQVLPGVSKWAFSYGVEANAPVSLLGKDGEIYAGYDGSYRSRFSSNPSASIYTYVDAYELSNFRIGFRTEDGFNIYGWVRNAFDSEYFDQLNFGPSNTGLIAGVPGDPRTWGGTVRFEF